jgi:hypothetical protein
VTRHDGELRLADWFCGGFTQAIATIPGVRPVHAANHWDCAIESHAANFPHVDHQLGDIRALDVARLPYAELFWASPECPQWSQANGEARTYATLDEALPGLEPVRDVEAERSRALMEEMPPYLRATATQGAPGTVSLGTRLLMPSPLHGAAWMAGSGGPGPPARDRDRLTHRAQNGHGGLGKTCRP